MLEERPTHPGLAEEIQQTRPFSSPEAEAYLNLVRTASVLTDAVSTLLKQEGISHPQYNGLRILRGAGPEGLPCREVGARLVARVPDVSRLLDRLHKAGWIERDRDDGDRRVVRVTLSDAGRELLSRIDEPLDALHRRQLSNLSTEELTELSRLLVLARSGAAG